MKAIAPVVFVAAASLYGVGVAIVSAFRGDHLLFIVGWFVAITGQILLRMIVRATDPERTS